MIKLNAAARLTAYDSTWSDKAEKKMKHDRQGKPVPQAFKDEDIFSLDPNAMAQRMKQIHPDDLKTGMSSLTFHKNRAGKNMTTQDKARFDQAKDHLRKLYDKDKPNEGQRSKTNPSTKPASKPAPNAGGGAKPAKPIGSRPTGRVVGR